MGGGAMNRLSGLSMLSCAVASALVMHSAFPGRNAGAGSSEAVVDTHAQLDALIKEDEKRRAQAEKADRNADTANAQSAAQAAEAKLPAEAEAAGHGEVSALAAAAKA